MVPDLQSVRRNPWEWKPVSRAEAMRLSAIQHVLVVHSTHGCESAAWFQPSAGTTPASPEQASARFFVYSGSLTWPGRRSWPTSNGSSPRPPEALEALEFLDPAGIHTPIVSTHLLKKVMPAVREILAGRQPATAPASEDRHHPVEILLVSALGEPLPRSRFRITWPNGETSQGQSDREGFIRIPDNRQHGEMELLLLGYEIAAEHETTGAG